MKISHSKDNFWLHEICVFTVVISFWKIQIFLYDISKKKTTKLFVFYGECNKNFASIPNKCESFVIMDVVINT